MYILFCIGLFRSAQACQTACAPGDLQVKAAGPGVQIQDFSGHIEAFDNFRFHGGRIDLRGPDAAPCDNGFPEASGPGGRHGNLLDQDGQFPDGGLPDCLHRSVFSQPGQQCHLLGQSGREQRPQGIGKFFSRRGGKFPLQPLLQLLQGDGRLQILPKWVKSISPNS